MSTTQARIEQLIQLQMKQGLSIQEQQELLNYMQDPLLASYIRILLEDAFQHEPGLEALGTDYQARILNDILAKSRQEERKKFTLFRFLGKGSKLPQIKNIKRFSQIAAAVLILITISIWISYKLHLSKDVQHQLYVSHHASVDSTENRYVQLPDSSVVILRYGSELEIVSDFEGETREVTLIGEGYFDIKRNEKKPFIVHTKDIKTVVLGTAFTIKAYRDEKDVEVTVQQGKVRVEPKNLKPVELLASEQVLVSNDNIPKKNQDIAVEATLHWTSDDLHFEGIAFSILAQRLERRYGVKIEFANKTLGNCRMNGSFDGTENLAEILRILCATNNATYKVNGDTFQIYGVGCQPIN